ncbi:MAG: UDP-N-acetylglucosamine 1-carboxyvinyltransferase [Pseudomonadota bacterium]
MEKFIIKGGKQLKGEVKVSGAKNAALPLMAAALLAPGTHTFQAVPKLRDIKTMEYLLQHLGATCDHTDVLTINADEIRADDAPYEVVKTMRASVLVMGPLVARLKHARVSLPGGCAIGARPIDLHLKALASMGADITLHDGLVEVKAKELKGANIFFDKVTVTGTENIMMAACLAKGKTVLENAAREPEVIDLANYLNKMGAKVKGAGTDKIVIQGVKELKPSSHTVMPDRIEAATLIIAAALTQGNISIKNAPLSSLDTVMLRLTEVGIGFDIVDGALKVSGPEDILSVDMTTAPYPGFATDVQAQFMSLMTIANGTSVIKETIFENRFMHVPELSRMGADITIDGGTAVVKGKKSLVGAPVQATDLRASACLVLAGLVAKGITEVNRIYHLDRGYESLEKKLGALGAEIERV